MPLSSVQYVPCTASGAGLGFTKRRPIGDVSVVGVRNFVCTDVINVVGPFAASDGETPPMLICMRHLP